MYSFPIDYVEPVFRPPSEAKSLILPVTNGCSWNKCTFCEMYTQPQKKFRARKPEDVLQDIRNAARSLGGVRRVFLADGDAMVLPTRRLLEILGQLREAFPDLQRVSSYCLPRNLAKKTVEELAQLKDAGLEILYVGMESGDDEILRRVNKGETWESTRSALLKIREAGLTSSGRRKPFAPARDQYRNALQRDTAGLSFHPRGQFPTGRRTFPGGLRRRFRAAVPKRAL